MRINFSHVKIDGERRQGEESGEMLDMANDPDLRPGGPVKYDFFVQPAGSELVVRGTIETDFTACCAKCGKDFTMNVKANSFTRAYCPREISDIIDLTEDMREDIILALPSNAVCSPACRGLCARCGKNLNNEECLCVNEETSGRWSILDGLKPR